MKTDTKGCMLWFHVDDFLEKAKLETENRSVVSRLGHGKGELTTKGHEGNLGADRSILDLVYGVGDVTVYIYQNWKNYPLKISEFCFM